MNDKWNLYGEDIRLSAAYIHGYLSEALSVSEHCSPGASKDLLEDAISNLLKGMEEADPSLANLRKPSTKKNGRKRNGR